MYHHGKCVSVCSCARGNLTFLPVRPNRVCAIYGNNFVIHKFLVQYYRAPHYSPANECACASNTKTTCIKGKIVILFFLSILLNNVHTNWLMPSTPFALILVCVWESASVLAVSRSSSILARLSEKLKKRHCVCTYENFTIEDNLRKLSCVSWIQNIRFTASLCAWAQISTLLCSLSSSYAEKIAICLVAAAFLVKKSYT